MKNTDQSNDSSSVTLKASVKKIEAKAVGIAILGAQYNKA
jgi:hypothetical protein